MTMHPQAIYLIPAETERVARAAFPKGSLIMRICDEMGMLMTDRELAHLFPACLLYTSPSPRDRTRSRMPSSA